jgi:hypothetical protein
VLVIGTGPATSPADQRSGPRRGNGFVAEVEGSDDSVSRDRWECPTAATRRLCLYATATYCVPVCSGTGLSCPSSQREQPTAHQFEGLGSRKDRTRCQTAFVIGTPHAQDARAWRSGGPSCSPSSWVQSCCSCSPARSSPFPNHCTGHRLRIRQSLEPGITGMGFRRPPQLGRISRLTPRLRRLTALSEELQCWSADREARLASASAEGCKLMGVNNVAVGARSACFGRFPLALSG